MRVLTALLAATVVVLMSGLTAGAQTSESSQPSASITAPRVINISGAFRPADRQTRNRVEVVTVAIYAEETGGTPLWQETQSITVAASGRYTFLLGATQPDGVPIHAFASGEARWLGVQVAGEAEQPRVMLVAVPYALAAGDAQTLGGKPATAYLQAVTDARDTATTTTASLTTPRQTSTTPSAGTNAMTLDGVNVQFTDTSGTVTGYAVQNFGSGAASYSGMLFYDQNGALGQFQGFNNSTHEYRINNIASGGTINFMTGSTSRLKVDSTGNIGIGTGTPSTKLYVVASGTTALVAQATSSRGVEGQSSSSYGVIGFSNSGAAVLGQSTGTGPAGQFNGNVNVSGTLTKGGGAFKIDHPLDPANKYLQHSFVESPDMMNVYNGNAVLDSNGETWVALPDWFEALNRDFRYQLTSIGAPANPYIAVKVAGNRFKIAGGAPFGEVSWQVTGVRQDAWANAHRIIVEEDKASPERGLFLHPEVFGLSNKAAVPAVQQVTPTTDARPGGGR